MRISIRTRQIAAVTAIVGLVVLLSTGWYLSSLVGILLRESRQRGELVALMIYQRAFEVLASGEDPLPALQADGGIRSILEASIYSGASPAGEIAYAAIVDPTGRIAVHYDPTQIGEGLRRDFDFEDVIARGPIERLQVIYAPGGRMLEVRQPLLIGDEPFASIRVGFSTLLIREQLEDALEAPIITGFIAIVAAVLVGMLLAHMVVRPIHVIRSSLARLGRGELDLPASLPDDRELGELEDSFKAVVSRIHAERAELAGRTATLESVAGQLEDGVALFGPDGALLFANPAMRPYVGEEDERLQDRMPPGHPYRVAVEQALEGSIPAKPTIVHLPEGGERQIMTRAVSDTDGRPLGVMLVVRDMSYITEVESTLSYSRKLAALSRLSAGIAHEIKNPLNAIMIHLELLKLQATQAPDASEHLAIITAQLRRLDEVVQGFLKFTRPEDLKLQPVAVSGLIAGLLPILEAEASKSGVDIRVDCPADLPPVAGDRGMLEQAFLNLGLNACQAMPNGGRLRITARPISARQVEVSFEDTGTGIPPEHLSRIFDLYFTTRPSGSGIGLSLVFRTIQLHDGDIEVQSTPGHGTTFRVILRRAEIPATVLPIAAS